MIVTNMHSRKMPFSVKWTNKPAIIKQEPAKHNDVFTTVPILPK